MDSDQIVEFKPLIPRFVCLLLWLFVASLPAYAVSTVSGIVAFAGVAPVLGTLVVLGCFNLRLVFASDYLEYRNALSRRRHAWSEIEEISFKRLGSAKMVTAETASQLPLFLTIYGIRVPGVAIRLHSGGISAPISITMFLGSGSRQALLDVLVRYTRNRAVPLKISVPNRGGLWESCGIRSGIGAQR